MTVSCWETARSAIGRPALDLLEHRYRRLPLGRPARDPGGFVALRGTIRRDGDWLAIDRDVWLDPSSAVMLVEDDRLDGCPGYALGRLDQAVDARGTFTSYRTAPRRPVLLDGWLLDPAAWTYYRAGRLGRAVYRALGLMVGCFDAARQVLRERRRWLDRRWVTRAWALVGLVALLLGTSGVLVLRAKMDFVQQISSFNKGWPGSDKATDKGRPAVIWSDASAGRRSGSSDDRYVRYESRSETTPAATR